MKKIKKCIDKIKKLMYYINMKTIKNNIEMFEKNKETIAIIETWTFDGIKKPLKKWYFKKEEEIRIKDSADNTVIIDNLLEYKEYKSKQAVYKKFNKEKNILEEK